MKAKFIVTTSLGRAPQLGLEKVSTSMLMLTKVAGTTPGDGIRAVDQSLDGLISKRVGKVGFKGDLGEHLTFSIGANKPQENVLLVGLGRASKFDTKALCQVVGLAVDQALAKKAPRLSIPILPNRLTDLNLQGTAHIIKALVERKLAKVKGSQDAELEIELVCTPQAKRHIEAGLACGHTSHVKKGAEDPCCATKGKTSASKESAAKKK